MSYMGARIHCYAWIAIDVRKILALLAWIFIAIATPARADDRSVRDCADCPAIVRVEPGSYVMGSPPTENYRGRNEDQISVSIRYPFFIGVTPVTVAEFEKFVAATEYDMSRGCMGYVDSQGYRYQFSWQQPGFVQARDHPVTCVSWKDAEAYVEWLSNISGHKYRLPTEAEYEYAARAGTTTPFWFGAAPNTVQARFSHASNSVFLWLFLDWNEGTRPVAQFKPNPWGLHDVHGNVWQIMEDCYTDSNAGNPGDGRALQAGNCDRRVVRGGGWNTAWFNTRSANRHHVRQDDRYNDRGFRVVRTIE